MTPLQFDLINRLLANPLYSGTPTEWSEILYMNSRGWLSRRQYGGYDVTTVGMQALQSHNTIISSPSGITSGGGITHTHITLPTSSTRSKKIKVTAPTNTAPFGFACCTPPKKKPRPLVQKIEIRVAKRVVSRSYIWTFEEWEKAEQESEEELQQLAAMWAM